MENLFVDSVDVGGTVDSVVSVVGRTGTDPIKGGVAGGIGHHLGAAIIHTKADVTFISSRIIEHHDVSGVGLSGTDAGSGSALESGFNGWFIVRITADRVSD